MAIKSLYFKDAVPAGASTSLSLQDGGTAPTGALTTTGWTVAKLAATNQSAMLARTKRASNTFAAADAITTFAASACFRSENRFNGTFANTNWTLAFRIRCSVVSTQTGNVKVRVWKSTNADGTGATGLTGSTQTGTTTAVLATGASATSTVTWVPGSTIVLNGEYIWVQCEWNIVATSGSNTADAVIYVESAGVITTPDFVLGAITGTIGATEAGDVAAFAGKESEIRGPLAAWEATIAPTADTTRYFADSTLVTADAVNPNDTAIFAGNVATGPVAVTGTLAATEITTDTAAFAGIVGRSGTLAVTEGTADIAAFAGTVRWNAALAATEGADTASFVGKAGLIGTLAATEVADTASFAGTSAWVATLAATEATKDTAAFGGSILTGIVGSLAATEAPDTAVFNAVAGWGAKLAATEARDTCAFRVFVGPVVTGTLAANESYPYLASMDAYLASSTAIKVYDYRGSDTALFQLELQAVGTFAVTETADVFAGTGYLSVPSEKYGTLNAFEDRVGGYSEPRADSTLVTADNTLFHVSIDYYGQDKAYFTTSINNTAVLNAYESGGIGSVPTADSTLITADDTIYTADMHRYPGDSANFNGEVVLVGTFAAIEDSSDTASFQALTEAYGVLAAVEERDVAQFFAEADFIHGVIAAVEGHDVARFSVPIWEDVREGDGLRNEVQRTIWLAGQGGRVTWLENEVEDTGFLQNLDPEVLSLVAEQERITRLGA